MSMMLRRATARRSGQVFAVGQTLKAGVFNLIVYASHNGANWRVLFHDTVNAIPDNLNGAAGFPSLARADKTLVIAGKVKPSTTPTASGDTFYRPVSTSVDGGLTWSVNYAPIVGGLPAPPGSISVSLLSGGPGGFIVGTDKNSSAAGAAALIAYSEDGVTWGSAPQDDPFESGTRSILQVGHSAFADGKFVCGIRPGVVGSGPTLRSQRAFTSLGGSNFTVSLTATSDNYVLQTIAGCSGKGFIGAATAPSPNGATHARIFYSGDGSSWTDYGILNTGLSGSLTFLAVGGAGVFLLVAMVGTNATIFRSADGGASWAQVSSKSGFNPTGLAFGGNKRFYAWSAGEVWSSRDKGVTWNSGTFEGAGGSYALNALLGIA